MDYRGLMRRQLLEKIYNKMTPEEKRLFIQLTLENKGHREIMNALQQQRTQISAISDKVGKQSWLTDFGSDVAANFLTDGIIWIAGRLFRRL